MKTLKSKKGFTLIEMLCTISILLMVCATTYLVMKAGISNYVKNMKSSQAQILCSALTTKISDELRYAESVSTDTDINPSFVGSQSTYGKDANTGKRDLQKISYTVSDKGRLALAQGSETTEVYLGQGIYSSGLYKLCVAELDTKEDPDKFWIKYDSETKIFTVNLVITASSESSESSDPTIPLATNQFQVKTLN